MYEAGALCQLSEECQAEVLNLAQLADGASALEQGAGSFSSFERPQDTEEHFPDELEESFAGLDWLSLVWSCWDLCLLLSSLPGFS